MSEDFWGIDDPQEVERIEHAINARTQSHFRVIFYLGGFGAVAAAIGKLLGPHYPVLAVIASIAVFLFGLLTHIACEVSRYERAKAEVLTSMGRCLNCGYKLEPHTESSCPECGRTRDSPAQPLQ
ncbi:MAG TPA: hypothetical protein VJZ71_10675 [Phycisphaerae bacterium]|nr:hypothetical protein [Phycisphaerae bacterium]